MKRTTKKENEMKSSLSRCAFPVIVLVLLGAVALSAWIQENPRTVYERARLLDEGNQNLAEAIKLYSQVADSAKDQPALAARALVQMGLCQERLGQAEARKAYQRVLAEYPQQLEEVKLARERLAVLTQHAGDDGKPRFRKIQIPGKLSMEGSGMLSLDGRTLAFISGGSLWVVPIPGKSNPDIAGVPVRLTEPMYAWDNANVSIAWSGDGKWIGFRVAVPRMGKPTLEEIYLVGAEGGKPIHLPITWADWPGDVYTLRYSLSLDARTLYFADGTSLENLRIDSMPASGGKRQPLTEPPARMPAVSPDGSRIAFVRMVQTNANEVHTRQVWMRPIQGGDPVLICETTGLTWLSSPIWSPDGNKVAFLSSPDEGGNRYSQIWIVPISGGKPASSPTKFSLPGRTYSLLSGWTEDDKIGVLLRSPQQHALYVVPATGGKAAQLTPKDSWMPSWSPDGKIIYFDGVHGGEYAAIERIPAEGGAVVRLPIDKEHEYLQPKYPHGGLSVSPDGKTLCFAGFYRRGSGTAGIFAVPIKGGTPTRLAGSEQRDSEPTWSPDGQQIAFIRTEGEPAAWNIFVMQADDREPRRITSREDKVQEGSIRWSPRGDLIAFFGGDNTLRVIPADGGTSRILASNLGEGLRWRGIAWSPDGNTLAYAANEKLYKAPRAGGAPLAIETGLDADARVSKIAWSPDGKSISFTANVGGEHELWLMEDFLPLTQRR
jgi:Tol biopolymer transport system component